MIDLLMIVLVPVLRNAHLQVTMRLVSKRQRHVLERDLRG
jgi:hypothetical protein